MKKLMILGAGTYQVPLIKQAKKMGLYVVVVSPGNYPGMPLADKVIDCDIMDEEGVFRAAEKEGIDGIISDESDMPVLSMAYTVDRLGLPGNSYEAVLPFIDKHLMRERCRKLGIDTIDYKLVGSADDAARYFDGMNGPAIIKPADSEVGVSLNASNLYQDYESGVSYETIAKGAADLADRSIRNQPEFDVDSFKDYDKMKGSLAMEVVSKERNAELLDTVPHKDIEDMSVVYRFDLGETSAGPGTILVTNQMLENYGITADQLHADAMKTAPEVRPLVIEGMCEVLAKQMGVQDLEMLGLNIPPEQEQIFVASVEGNVHGAGVLAYENFMEKASERVGGEDVKIIIKLKGLKPQYLRGFGP